MRERETRNELINISYIQCERERERDFPFCRMRKQQLCVELLSKILRNNGYGCVSLSKSKSVVVSPKSFSQYSPKICTPSLNLLAKRFSSNSGAGLFNLRAAKFPPLSFPNTRSLHSTRRSKVVVGWFTTDNVVLGLILANVAVFILWRVADTQFMINNFMISVENITSWRLHTLITSAFSQINSSHIVGNMIGLFCFGTSIGQCFGPQYLLKLYLTGAIAGSLFYLAYQAFIAPKLKGASGAVNAIMVLDIFLFPRKIIFYEMFIPLPAILVGIIIIGQDIFRAWRNDSRVSGSAHLGGATVAVLAWLQIKKGGRFRRRPF